MSPCVVGEGFGSDRLTKALLGRTK